MDDLNVVETEFTSWLMDGKKRKRRFVWTATLTSSAKEVFQRLLSDGVTPDAVLCTDRPNQSCTLSYCGAGLGISGCAAPQSVGSATKQKRRIPGCAPQNAKRVK